MNILYIVDALFRAIASFENVNEGDSQQRRGIMFKKQKRKVAVLLAFTLAVSSFAMQPVSSKAATRKITEITLNLKKKTLYEGKSVSLKVKKVKPAKASKSVTWKSSNKKVATVTSKGKVTAKKKGVAKITAVSKSNKKVKAVCKITVEKKKNTTPKPATPTPSKATKEPAKEGDILYSGSYQKTAWTIDKNGLLVVKGTGDMYSGKDNPGWYEYKKEITSARIEVKGATNLKRLFSNHGNMESVDLSKLNTSKVTDMSYMFFGCEKLKSLDVSKFDTSKVTNTSGMFSRCKKLKSLDVSKFDTSKVTYMGSMFSECYDLASLDVSKLNTSKVTDMSYMFWCCYDLTSLDLSKFNTSNVTNMKQMFYGCESLQKLDVSSFNTKKVENMLGMFGECVSLEELNISNLNTSKTTYMNYMFNNCKNLKKLDVSKFDTSKVTDMQYMFADCRSLTDIDISKFNTAKVANMQWMFANCKSLKKLDVSKFDTSKVIDMIGMFGGCNNLEHIDVSGFKTSKVIDMDCMFQFCIKLKSIDVSKFDTSNAKGMSYMFSGCSSLTSIDLSAFDLSKVIYFSYMFGNCSSLTSINLGNSSTSAANYIDGMFYNCSSLTSIDLSNLDTRYITSDLERNGSADVLLGCHNLQTICIGKNNVYYISLPAGKWTGSDGKEYSILPIKASEYITLKKTARKEKILSSGRYGNTMWILYETGLLEVSGSGNMYSDKPEWCNTVERNIGGEIIQVCSAGSITSAKIEVTGAINLSNLFSGCSNLKNVDISKLDASNVTDMSSMFSRCSSLTSIDVSKLDTSNVTNMSSMFSGCSSLMSLDLSKLAVSKVEDATNMFLDCNSLTSIQSMKENSKTITLPTGKWKGSDGKIHINIPANTTESITLEKEAIKEKILNSGECQNTVWFVYETGLLEVLGSGNMYYDKPEWCNTVERKVGGKVVQVCSAGSITSAKIEVTGATKFSKLFSGCSNLKYVDLTKLDTSRKMEVIENMFADCDSLMTIRCNKENSALIKLPTGKWRGNDGKIYTILPQNTAEDITLENIKDKIVRSGRYQNTMWFLYETGLLEVFGIGDMYEFGSKPEWCETIEETINGKKVQVCSAGSITAAKIEVTGASGLTSLFEGCDNLTSVDLSKLDTSDVVDMSNMFLGCSKLVTIKTPKKSAECTSDLPTDKISVWNDSNGWTYKALPKNATESIILTKTVASVSESEDVKYSGTYNAIMWTIDEDGLLEVKGNGDMYLTDSKPEWCSYAENIKSAKIEVTGATHLNKLFLDCANLESVDLTGLDTSNVTDMSSMFSGCSSLTKVNINSFDSSSVTKLDSMFLYCRALEELDLSRWDISKVTEVEYMLFGCDKMTKIYTPKKTGDSLLALPKGGWLGSDGKNYTELPENAVESITLMRKIAPTIEGDIVYSGAFVNTMWTIDKNGLLYVEGTGDMYANKKYVESKPDWCDDSMREAVKTAKIEVTGATHLENLFVGCSNLVSVDLSKLDTSNVTNMSGMFKGCSSLTSIDRSEWDTSNVTNMSGMFYECSSLTSLDLSDFDISKLTGDKGLFSANDRLTTIQTPKKSGTSTRYLPGYSFMSASAQRWLGSDGRLYTEFPQNATESITLVRKLAPPIEGDIIYSGSFGNTIWTVDKNGLLYVEGTGDICDVNLDPIWRSNDSIRDTIKSAKIEVTEITSLDSLFEDCSNLTSVDLSKLDTSKVTRMSKMFYGCENLTSVDLSKLDTSKVTDMSEMFYGCSNLTSVDVTDFDTSNVIYMSGIFSGCKKLTSLDLSSFDVSNLANDQEHWFSGCDSLTKIQTPKKTGECHIELEFKGWTYSDEKSYSSLPCNANESIFLTRKIE